MTRKDLIEGILSKLCEGSKYRSTLTRLAKGLDPGDYELTGFEDASSYGRHLFGGSKLPAAQRARKKIFKAMVDYETAGSKAWSGTLNKPRRGEGLQRAFIKAHSRKAKLHRQGYGPEMKRIRTLKRLPTTGPTN